MINNKNNILVILSIVSVLIALLLPPVVVNAGAILQEDFTGPYITRGEKIPIKDNATGWIVRYEKGNDLAVDDVVTLPVDSQAFKDSGSISFLVKRHRVSAQGAYSRTSAYNSVLWFLDETARPLMGVYLIWQNGYEKPEQTTLEIGENAYPASIDPWGTLPIGEMIPVGGWLHLTLTWDADAGEAGIFVNGKDISSRSRISEADRNQRLANLVLALEQASNIRIGSDVLGSDPAFETLIAEIMVDDSALDALEAEALFRETFRKYGLLPEIKSVSHNAFEAAGYSGKLVSGDTYTVTMKAEPGGTATFDLGPVKNHQMTEDPGNPGTYLGTHIVEYGNDVEEGHVIGHFVDKNGTTADPVLATSPVTIDTKVYMDVNSSNDLIPADEESKAGITVVAKDANGKAVRDHELKLTMSTTDEYTGIMGGGTFEDMVGGEMDVDWGGVTDSFGEVTAQYQSGFAAKTIVISAKDMVSGDVGVGYVRSYITGTVDVLVKKPRATALSLSGSMDVSVSREWLTADGKSRSRITAVIKDQDGDPLKGHNIQFTLHGNNGKIRTIKSWTDFRGRAFADYIAGTVIGEVQIEVRDMTGGHVAVVSIQLRSDAPAEIALTAEPGEVFTDDKTGSVITAKVTDANGNPNFNTDVLFEVEAGGGAMSADSAVTDEKNGIASVSFLPGSDPGLSTIKATVMSRAATTEEIAAAEGAVFLYGLDEDPGRLEVVQWLAEPGDEVTEGEDLVKLEDRRGKVFTVKAPRDGTVSVFTAEEDDRVEYGQTLGYVLPLEE